MLTKTKKGYSLIMWTTTFAVVVAALAIVRMPLKRALQTKVRQTADYMLWRRWGNAPELEPTEKTSRMRSNAFGQQKTTLSEDSTGSLKILLNPAENQRQESTVSWSVEKGSEALLNSFRP